VLFILGWFEKKNSRDKKQSPRSNFNVIYPKQDPYYGFFENREKQMQTVGDAAAERYPNMTYDCALPQNWVDQCCNKGLDPRGHFVWLYDNFSGRPAPISREGDRIVSLLALDP
jgi:hypothetical protein